VDKSHIGVCYTPSETKEIPKTGYPPYISKPYEPISSCFSDER
jgi:hypothetical protein